jgi:hypothetical protein
MAIEALVLMGAVLAGQVEQSPTQASPLRVEPAPSPPLVMRWGGVVNCVQLPATPSVPSGAYRVQCDDKKKVCLASSLHELDSGGVETRERLTRVQSCGRLSGEPEDLARAGYRFVQAIPESPPGWIRDERGRVMQFNFDMNRRVLLGAGVAPIAGVDPQLGRLSADFGIQAEWPGSDDERSLYRLHVLETELILGSAFGVDSTLVRYDWSNVRQQPLVRITTFFGTPRRHDLSLDVGAWAESMHLESLQRGGGTFTYLTLGAVQGTVDLWHSRDLASFVRLRGGGGAEWDLTHRFTAFKPQVAFEGDLTLDPDGFHHVRFAAEAEKLFGAAEVLGRPQSPARLRVRAGYELILIAINDQPLTLAVDGRGVWRDDLPEVPGAWEWSARAGLRFNFWAPARRSATVRQGG